MTAPIVVFGATGYTGRLAVEALLRRGTAPVIMGRREPELAALAQDLGGLEYRVADVTDPTSVRSAVNPGEVLLSTVGPFGRFGRIPAQVAAETGVHYVDSTGEVGFVRDIQSSLDVTARTNGVTMIPAFGYDYVPGLLAGALALAEAPDAASMELGYFATGSLRKGLSQGTKSSMADGITLPNTVWRDGRLAETRAAETVRDFTVHGRKKSAFLVSGTEVLFLPEIGRSLTTVEVFNGWFPSLSRTLSMASAVANLVSHTTVGAGIIDCVSRKVVGPSGGPDFAERARTLTHVVARARDSSGRDLAEVHLEGPSIYTLTGELLATAAEKLASGEAQKMGVLSPLEVFGVEIIEQEAARIGLRRVSI
ncbi:trans-acting enoyl reductase family protein [Corynebacterium sp.]|uniref:saccharopine dehydrogenase family protein n=1 Tax=Corynebacterium sp. TaxID=1720 RepID=UPI0025BE2356|nr:saccharopine dehydrogenase NADP-binding domain-containing protein [Corynebacterium sp.]